MTYCRMHEYVRSRGSTSAGPGVSMSDRVPAENDLTGGNNQGKQPTGRDIQDPADRRVLGKVELTVSGHSVSLGVTSQRLLTLLAIRSGQVRAGQVLRGHAAGKLWPETRTARATANLRSAIWRLQQSCPGVV